MDPAGVRDGAEAARPRGPDRRRRPTPMVSKYTFLGGRRGSARRDGEREGAYVDRYSTRLAVLLLFFFVLTVVDSVSTVFYLRKGGFELNPVARYLLSHGEVHFVVWKGLLTGLCLMFVLLHKNFRHARYAIAIGFAFYFALAVYHAVLQIQAWQHPTLTQ